MGQVCGTLIEGEGKRGRRGGNERERRPAATCHGWLCHDMLTDQVRSVRFTSGPPDPGHTFLHSFLISAVPTGPSIDQSIETLRGAVNLGGCDILISRPSRR